MSTVKVQGNASGTGSITLASPNTNNNQVATLPDRTGNIAMDGPAFSAYLNTNQSISSATQTKIQFSVEEFDTNSNYDNSTNYRFTPTVAGYYQITIGSDIAVGSGTISGSQLSIYKNGSRFKTSGGIYGAASEVYLTCSALIYFNGSTDYVEGYAYISGTSPVVYSGSNNTYLQGFLARAA